MKSVSLLSCCVFTFLCNDQIAPAYRGSTPRYADANIIAYLCILSNPCQVDREEILAFIYMFQTHVQRIQELAPRCFSKNIWNNPALRAATTVRLQLHHSPEAAVRQPREHNQINCLRSLSIMECYVIECVSAWFKRYYRGDKGKSFISLSSKWGVSTA